MKILKLLKTIRYNQKLFLHYENFKYRKSESEFENQVNKIIDSFLLMTLQPISDLLIILLNFLKNLEDDTFEHERELITQSQKLYSEYMIFDKYLNKNK
ncbi:hypothetical protein NAPIS_ORF02264 [Vairimorpha apis BRL 01]|uniref:Uncharacterized protein n=1 Tax=Vairimorpha apis BRL 01 TaxID=1037528 RepID=T0M9U4_9MICR|nr:hypothetical protein NAPIS_ORF02264 [Vairimorpha apis BRL 01]